MAVNAHNDAANFYYSGQGVVMIAPRNPTTGGPQGPYIAVGNCSSLKISLATTVIDHKGAQDGLRAIDKRLITEIKANVEVVLESFTSANLAQALQGAKSVVPAGSVTAELSSGYVGGVTPFANINVSSPVLTNTLSSTVLTGFTAAGVAYDYTVDLDAGSYQLNNPVVSGVSPVSTGVVPTAITVGTTTVFTVPTGSVFNVGDTVYVYGATGTNAATVNNLAFLVTATTATSVTLNAVTTALTITVAAATRLLDVTSGVYACPVSAAYTYSVQYQVDALTLGLQEFCLRFEGLNTVNVSTTGIASPVVVDIFRFSSEPLKELSLISDTFDSFTLDGIAISDPTRPVGTSKFFNARQLVA